MAEDTTYWKIAGAVLIVGLLLMVILLPLSFSDVEYYEIAFKQRKSTGTVYTDKVYSGGRHLVGPDYKFKHYQADAHLVEFTSTDLDVSTSDKLSIQLTAHMQYFLREEDLHELHRRFDKGYKPIVRNTAKTAIKNAAKVFSKDEFRYSREIVERALFKAVRKALGGICCRKDCSKYECEKGCKKYSNCNSEDKGIFVDARYFQLHDFDITETLKERWLDQVIKRENTEKESYIQDEQIERKLTEKKKEEYENKIREVNEAAAANVTIIDAQAEAESLRIVEDARNQGLKHLYEKLNFENEQHKASFNYLRTLRKHKNIRLHVNFGNLISGPNTGN